jgi:hypothetical protein
MADISDWLTYPQAAKLTGIPRRTLERRVAEGRLVVASRRGGGRKPMSVLDPHGLQNLVAEEEKSLSLMRSEPQQVATIPPPPPVVQITHAAPDMQGRHEIVLRRASRSRFVTLDAASEYCGLPRAYLERLIRDQRLPAIKSGAWYVATADLDAIRP